MDHIVTVGMIAWSIIGILGVVAACAIVVAILFIIASGYNH